ncbi:MAG: regulatory iron-sulfur-containing complex subunit RicT [Candidatus Hydrogenedentes bacterium]|nr:regulatory iron-sulfur-containing complex subunit RicT [Candidatus Hydrogenedentota bacterium]
MTTVKVRLRKPTRVFTFLCEDIPLQRNEDCIVRTERGLEYGTCIVPPEPIPEGAKSRYKMNVVRKITHQDETTYHHIQMEEERAKETCWMRIRERSLPMKLVDAEFTFDRHKIIFYFTADDRVDFRQLVRDLAQDLKTRIELRHIQVRDEAKIVGGIGVCGRELCCSTWLREFKPISMKMAKRQNLSLNPSKISGQCGRLLCCLSYENEQYQEHRGRREMSAVAGRDETEVVDYQEAMGHEGAFARSDIRHKPDDWEERLDDMGGETGMDIAVSPDGNDEEHVAVVDFGNDEPQSAPQFQQRPRRDDRPSYQDRNRDRGPHPQQPDGQQPSQQNTGPHTQGRRRRHRRFGSGGGGGQPGGGNPGAGS